jgi:hypothetical protein
MQGFPLTRVQSPDGRWAYTFYTGQKPFIHALDTAGRTAVCIDVPQVSADNSGDLRLALAGGGLQVLQQGKPVALVDLKSFKVTAPRTAAAAAATPRPAIAPPRTSTTDGGPPMALWIVPLVAFAAVAVLARRRRARHSATG